MFDLCLVSSLSPMVFYNILLPMFSAGRSPASLLLVCVPPRPTAAWLLLRSVVPYHSLYLLLLLRPSHQVRLLFLSTSLLSLGYPSPTPPSLFLTGYFNAQISGFRYPSPAPPRLFLTGYFNAQISGFRYPSPAPPRLFLTGYFDAQVSAFRYPSPAPPRLLLTGYLDAQVSGFRCPSPAPPRLFLAGYLDAQVSVFRCPSPTPPRLFLTGYFDAQVSLFRYPRAFFSLPVLVSLIVFFDALLFSHPTFPSRLLGWPARSLCRLAVRLRFLPLRGFYHPAVFTAPRFLPLRGFYRSAFAGFFFGGSALSPPSCLLPPSLHPLPGGSLFVPPCGSPAIFTAPRFLPLSGFYRSAFAGFLGALLFRRPHAGCPPVFTHFRAARSLCHLAVRLRFLPPRVFYRSAVFTASRFLPLRDFYRSAFAGFFFFFFFFSAGGSALPPPSCLLPPSLHPLPGGSLFVPPCGTPAIFTAPRFLPLRGFYRSAVFTAPRFLPLRDFYRSAFAGSLGGSALPCCPPVFALFRAHPVLPARP